MTSKYFSAATKKLPQTKGAIVETSTKAIVDLITNSKGEIMRDECDEMEQIGSARLRKNRSLLKVEDSTEAVNEVSPLKRTKGDDSAGKRSKTISTGDDTISQAASLATPFHREVLDAFCAPRPSKYRCRFAATCVDCFEISTQCVHHVESRLDLLLLGHNPSFKKPSRIQSIPLSRNVLELTPLKTHVWEHGYQYGQPSNNMWKLLTGTFGKEGFEGCIPSSAPIQAQNSLPLTHRIGFTDVVCLPGSDAAAFSDPVMRKWVPNLIARLRGHLQRVQARDTDYVGPSIIAFTGKRQFLMMFPSKKLEPKNVPFGRVAKEMVPPNWPFPSEACQIWVLPSSSGRAVMTQQERAAPYSALAEELRRVRDHS